MRKIDTRKKERRVSVHTAQGKRENKKKRQTERKREKKEKK